jgi:hypothetical protein
MNGSALFDKPARFADVLVHQGSPPAMGRQAPRSPRGGEASFAVTVDRRLVLADAAQPVR